MAYLTHIIIGAGGALFGLLIGSHVLGRSIAVSEEDFLKKKKGLLKEAKQKAQQVTEEAREQGGVLKKQAQENNARLETQLQRSEESLVMKEKQVERRENRNDELNTRLKSEEETVEALRKNIHEFEGEIQKKLVSIAKVDTGNVKQQLLVTNEKELKKRAQTKIEQLEMRMKDEAPRRAKEIIREAIYRYAAETSVDRREREITVPRDERKIDFIGKNGENLQLIEEMLPDVNIVFNDAPEVISIYSFDLIQEHIARVAIKELIKSRHIDTVKVRRVVEKAQADMQKIFHTIGKEANKRIGLKDPAPELLETIGRTFFRTSYGQNILKHSFEVGNFARIMAAEVGANVEETWIAAFFHDIGKAIDKLPENEGIGHDYLSKRILEEHGFSTEIVDAAWRHHEAEPINSIEGQLVQAADAISAGRPGARSESLQQYLERIKLLEETASGFPGIEKVYAISAGREVRLFVDPKTIDDAHVEPLAGQVAGKIESELSYPGSIRVNVIRKTKSTEVARKK